MGARIQYNLLASLTVRLPMEEPRVVFERLFGDGTTAAQRLTRKQQDKSILDLITDDRSTGGSRLRRPGAARRALENSEVERRIRRRRSRRRTPRLTHRASRDPHSFEDHQADVRSGVAYQADITRVSTT
jgi:hypothetical protein